MRLLDELVTRYPASKKITLRNMLAQGRVRVNGRVVKAGNVQIAPADTVEVMDRVKAPASPPARLPVPIIFEDAHVLVVNKPAGLLTSTVPNEKRPTLAAMVQTYLKSTEPHARLGLIHRLDKDAAGLLIFSKNNECYLSLKRQLKDRSMERVYHAIVDGLPAEPSGTIRSRLVELPDGRVRPTRRPDSGEPAVTHYKVLETRPPLALLELRLETGRKHQIRAHCTDEGWPILGDRMYHPHWKGMRLMLAATSLGIVHPSTGEKMRWSIDVPFKLPD